MTFDPLAIVGRNVFSADGCVFLDAPPAAAPPLAADALGGAVGSEAPRADALGGAVGSEAPRADEQPTFGKLLGVSPRFVARHARSATEATLLMDVASAAAELDVLLESLADQLGDRARILDGLVGVDRQGESERSSLAHATLLALQVQARDTNNRNVERLLERFQLRFQALLDLRFLLAQELEKHRACLSTARSIQSRVLDATRSDASPGAWREETIRLEGILLERLNALERKKGMPSVFESLARYEGDSSSSAGAAGREICWPALSNPGSDESKRSENNVRLSTTFASLQSSSTTMSSTSANDVALSE